MRDGESSESPTDVDALMARVKAEAARRRRSGTPVADLDAGIAEAAARNEPRTNLPRHLMIFPLSLAPVRALLVRASNLASQDQRRVNAALIDALRESAACTTELEARVAELEQRIRALEQRD
jgi:hypothetical protein